MRYAFAVDFAHELRIRGLSLTDVAHISGVSLPTVSSAVRGKRVNITTALRIARAVAARDVVPELSAWSNRSDVRASRTDAGYATD